MLEKAKLYHLENMELFIKENSNVGVLFDIDNNKFYEKKIEANLTLDDSKYSIREVCDTKIDVFFFCLQVIVFLSAILLIKEIIFSDKNMGNNLNNPILFLVFLIMNIVIHEFAHYTLLRMYKRKTTRIGLKFFLIFPAFYVNTSESYMLTKYKRINIYCIGITTNILLCWSAQLFGNYCDVDVSNFILPIIIMCIINLVPLPIKNDGFYIFSTLFSKNWKANESRRLETLFKILIVSLCVIYVLYMIWKGGG